MAAGAGPRVSVEALTALGAARLADILHERARDDPPLRHRLETALAHSPPAPAKCSGIGLGSIGRRLAALRAMDGYHDWRGAASLGADIDTMRQDVMESVLPSDARAATGLLEELVDLQEHLFEMADDSDGEIGSALMAVTADWGRAWTGVANRDADTVAELVFDAFTENEYGVLDEVIPAFADALGTDGLDALEARFRAALRGEAEPSDAEDREREWSRRTLFHGLGQIADLRADVDAFIAAHQGAGTHLSHAVAIAERLHGAQRHREALRWLERAEAPGRLGELTTDLHVGILSALGRDDEARATRRRAFETTLAPEHYRDYLDRTSPPDREAVQRGAIDLARGHDNVHAALEILIAVEARDEAQHLVVRRAAEFRGRDYRSLRPAALALAPAWPVGAVVLYRILTEAVLCAGKSQYYPYALADLREATLLAEGVDDWLGIEDHKTCMERLRAEYGRKWSFWGQW